MAHQSFVSLLGDQNFFSLLGDQETEDVSKLIDSLKVEEPLKPAAALDKKKAQKHPKHTSSTSNSGKVKIEGKNNNYYHNSGYDQGQRGYRLGNRYQANYRNNSHGVADGCEQVNCNNGGYRGGRGRGFHQRKRFYENNGDEKESSQAIAYGNNNINQDQQQYHGGNNGGYRGGSGGRGLGFHQRKRFYENNGNEKESSEAISYGNNNINQHQQQDNKNDNVAVLAKEAAAAVASNGGNSKEGDKKSEMMKSKGKGVESKSVNKAEDKKVDDEVDDDGKKLMTLKEYEESLLEKKKPWEAALIRKASADKEFESMKIIIGKKKLSEEKKSSDEDKIKKDAAGLRKSMSIDEFVGNYRSYGRGKREGQRPFYGGGGRGGDSGGYGGSGGHGGRGIGDEYNHHLEDLGQFPALGRN